MQVSQKSFFLMYFFNDESTRYSNGGIAVSYLWVGTRVEVSVRGGRVTLWTFVVAWWRCYHTGSCCVVVGSKVRVVHHLCGCRVSSTYVEWWMKIVIIRLPIDASKIYNQIRSRRCKTSTKFFDNEKIIENILKLCITLRLANRTKQHLYCEALSYVLI